LKNAAFAFHELFLEPLMDRGIVWESADGHGALVLVPPEEADALDDALAIDDSKTHKVTDDGGRRYELFWQWVGSNIPREPLWHLDSVAVLPGWQGRGIGSALIEFGLEHARESGTAMVLETGTHRNVPLYERLGFHVVKERTRQRAGLTSGLCVATLSWPSMRHSRTLAKPTVLASASG
jgi:GNAT superfamily N-acetyltransferase